MNALILINPKAAGGRAQKLFPLIQDHLNAHLGPVKHIQIEMPESIDAGLHLLAQTKPNTRVVIVGGDGTLNQMLPGLMYSAFEIGCGANPFFPFQPSCRI